MHHKNFTTITDLANFTPTSLRVKIVPMKKRRVGTLEPLQIYIPASHIHTKLAASCVLLEVCARAIRAL